MIYFYIGTFYVSYGYPLTDEYANLSLDILYISYFEFIPLDMS